LGYDASDGNDDISKVLEDIENEHTTISWGILLIENLAFLSKNPCTGAQTGLKKTMTRNNPSQVISQKEVKVCEATFSRKKEERLERWRETGETDLQLTNLLTRTRKNTSVWRKESEDSISRVKNVVIRPISFEEGLGGFKQTEENLSRKR
jgi:hypothetical protein